MLRRVTLVRTDVSEELSASIIRITRIGELRTTLAVTSNRRTLTLFLVHRFLSPWCRRLYVPSKRLFLQEPYGITSQKTTFFIVTVVKTANLKLIFSLLRRSRTGALPQLHYTFRSVSTNVPQNKGLQIFRAGNVECFSFPLLLLIGSTGTRPVDHLLFVFVESSFSVRCQICRSTRYLNTTAF
jgi:hypothetical protein